MCFPIPIVNIFLQLLIIPYFRNLKIVRTSSLVGRYFYNVYIIKRLKMCFSYMSRRLINMNIILDMAITYRTVSVLFQSVCACLHKNVENDENTYPKERALKQM